MFGFSIPNIHHVLVSDTCNKWNNQWSDRNCKDLPHDSRCNLHTMSWYPSVCSLSFTFSVVRLTFTLSERMKDSWGGVYLENHVILISYFFSTSRNTPTINLTAS